MKWTSDDVKMVEKFIEIRDKGYYCDGTQLTEVYNRVLEKRVNPTNCGSCLRQRVNELADALAKFKRQLEKETPVEEPKEETINEVSSANSVCTKKPKTKKK